MATREYKVDTLEVKSDQAGVKSDQTRVKSDHAEVKSDYAKLKSDCKKPGTNYNTGICEVLDFPCYDGEELCYSFSGDGTRSIYQDKKGKLRTPKNATCKRGKINKNKCKLATEPCYDDANNKCYGISVKRSKIEESLFAAKAESERQKVESEKLVIEAREKSKRLKAQTDEGTKFKEQQQKQATAEQRKVEAAQKLAQQQAQKQAQKLEAIKQRNDEAAQKLAAAEQRKDEAVQKQAQKQAKFLEDKQKQEQVLQDKVVAKTAAFQSANTDVQISSDHKKLLKTLETANSNKEKNCALYSIAKQHYNILNQTFKEGQVGGNINKKTNKKTNKNKKQKHEKIKGGKTRKLKGGTLTPEQKVKLNAALVDMNKKNGACSKAEKAVKEAQSKIDALQTENQGFFSFLTKPISTPSATTKVVSQQQGIRQTVAELKALKKAVDAQNASTTSLQKKIF